MARGWAEGTTGVLRRVFLLLLLKKKTKTKKNTKARSGKQGGDTCDEKIERGARQIRALAVKTRALTKTRVLEFKFGS